MTECRGDLTKWRTTRSKGYYHIHRQCEAVKGHEDNLMRATTNYIQYHELRLCPQCAPLHPDKQLDVNTGRRQVRIPAQHRECLDTLVERRAAQNYSQLVREAIMKFVRWARSVAADNLPRLKRNASKAEVSVMIEQPHATAVETMMGVEQYPSLAATVRGAIDWYLKQSTVGEELGSTPRPVKPD